MSERRPSSALIALTLALALGLYANGTSAQDQTPPKTPTLPAFLRDMELDDEEEEFDDVYDDELEPVAPRRARTNAREPGDNAKDALRAQNLDYLALEREFRRVAPELAKLLPPFAPFSKRLPSRWGSLGLSTRQTERVYRVEEEYHREIAQLQARIEALTEERNEKLLDILTEKQKSKLERILKDAVDVKVGKKKKDGSTPGLERP